MVTLGLFRAPFKRFRQVFCSLGRGRKTRFGLHRDRILRASGRAYAAPETPIGVDYLGVVFIHRQGLGRAPFDTGFTRYAALGIKNGLEP